LWTSNRFRPGAWFACTKLAKVNRSKVALTGPKGEGYNEQEKYAGKSKMRKKTLGQHIVADPEICHGQPTFRGTRIRVAQVLKQVAQGMDWDKIIWQWRGTVSRPAIAEALQLAGEAFEEQNHSASRKSRSA